MDMKVIISGGSRGIGAAMVEKFTSCGATVAFIYNKSVEQAEQLAKRTGAFCIAADLSCAEGCKRAINEAVSLLCGVDVLINNAGISQFSLFTEISDEDWQKMLSVNLSSVFYCTRECAPYMIRQKKGRIINVSSMWGLVGASCEVHYSAAKAGVIGMTKALSKELGPSGVNVNCICPGVIDTDMNRHLSPDDISALKEETPLCRLGTPMDVAELAYFLAGEGASFITGQIISADGGFAV